MTSNHKPTPAPAVLTGEQEQRAAALAAARNVLRTTTGPFSSGPVDVYDLVDVARFILTGTAPWEETEQAPGEGDGPAEQELTVQRPRGLDALIPPAQRDGDDR